jgi:pyruvate dehydrogenase phosphatase
MSSSYCRLSSTWLFGVFDGHAGNTCARHVAARLFDYVCATALATHTQQTPSSADNVQGEKIERLLRDHRARLAQIDMRKHEHAVGEFARRFAEAGHDVSSVVVALQVCVCNEVRTGCQAAFVALDDDLSLAAKLPSAIDADLRAVESGCCACVAHVHGRDVHIANIGDSQAILGVYRSPSEIVKHAGSPTYRHAERERSMDSAAIIAQTHC